MKTLTKKQAKLGDFIKKFISQSGHAPTYKEIAGHFKVNVNAVQQQVSALEKKGYLERTGGIARGIKLKALEETPVELSHALAGLITVPLYGNVAAGEPIFADNNIEGYITVDKPRHASGELFAVTVRGDSMTDKKIIEKDKLIVRRQSTANDGEIVVALLEDEVTVKVFKTRGGLPYLQPANNKYDPIHKPFKILGIVVGLTRDFTAA